MKKVFKDIQKRNDDFVQTYVERLTLLSKENVKVREENEMLKERLRNMGITDFDVIDL